MAAGRIPTFAGYEPTFWWFAEAEQIFELDQYSDRDKLIMAEDSMIGDARRWFRWEDGRQPFRTWRELKFAMRNRFRTPVEQAIQDQPQPMPE